jgi:hypothetical protein
MLKRSLQILLLCLAVMMLTTGIALSSPFSSSVLIADHAPDPDAAIAQPTPSSQPTGSSQVDTPNPAQPNLKSDRDSKLEDSQAPQVDPSVPYDPYDYKAIREMNREIYGEVKGKDKE